MHNRTTLLIVAIIGIILLATGGTVGAMALTHSGFMGNNSNGSGFMGNNGNGNGMMGGQQGYQGTMGGYQQSPVNQGTPVPATTHLTIDIAMNQPGM